jgi:hypothetical protein
MKPIDIHNMWYTVAEFRETMGPEMASGMARMNQVSKHLPARRDLEKIEKIKLIAYRLWLARRDKNVSGDAESDYYQAEHILESHKSLKFFLLGSFAVSAIAFVLGRSAEENCANPTNAVVGLNELADEYEHRGQHLKKGKFTHA